MSMAQITEAAESLRSANEAYHGKIGQINAAVAAKSAEVDAFLLNAREKLAAPMSLLYDPVVIHSKTSLNIAPDPANNARSVWHQLTSLAANSIYNSSDATHFAALQLARANFYPPGFAENPQFLTDRSVTAMQFVLAPDFSDEFINAFLAERAIAPPIVGSLSFGPEGVIIPILDIPGQVPAKSLFVRFVNRVVEGFPQIPAETLPGPVANKGGNTNFAVTTINIHRK